MIKHLGLKNTVLVTNKYPDATMKVYVLKENRIKYIFKKAHTINEDCRHKNPDLILVDDKKLVTDMWAIESKKHGKKIITFNNTNVLMKHIGLIDKNTPIYLDFNLDKDYISDKKATKELYNKGYKKLYITTGYDLSNIPKSPWITEIIGKKPPFSKNLQTSINMNDRYHASVEARRRGTTPAH